MNAKFSPDLGYDSHVHFFGVGIPAVQWKIPTETQSLKLPRHLLNQNLIKGFGWSDSLPTEEFTKITRAHPNKRFCLSYHDGHTSFVSQNLLNDLNFKTKVAQKLECGALLSEVERDHFLKLIPTESTSDLKTMALYAQNVFVNAGINKVRHLTARKDHWEVLKKLEAKGLLRIEIEMFFSEFMGQDLHKAVETYKCFKDNNSTHLKDSGIKLFYDGSFGSSTAYTSLKDSAPPRISKENLKEKMRLVFEQISAPLAVHTIGDLALEDVLTTYVDLEQDLDSKLPTLHLEHAPIFTKKSLGLLTDKKRNCIFHFQPSHWIKDQKWYHKNRSSLAKSHKIYPFEFLHKHGYTFHFGSDAPVVAPSKKGCRKGLELIEADKLLSGQI